MEFVILLLLAGAAGIFLTGFFRLFRKGRRGNAALHIGSALVIFVAAAYLAVQRSEKAAHSAGYESFDDLQAAEAAQRDKLQRVTRTAEINARVRAEAERAAEEAARKARLAAKTKAMAARVADTFRDELGTPVESYLPNGQFCRDDGYCSFEVAGFLVTISGAGIAQVYTNSQKPHSKYREVCAAVFSALSGSDLGLAAEVIGQAFREATQRRVQADVLGVQIRVTPDFSDNLLACRFFQY